MGILYISLAFGMNFVYKIFKLKPRDVYYDNIINNILEVYHDIFM